MAINETVFEMHFHKSLMDFFRNKYGVGKGGLSFYKYSTQKEAFIGFDQAYVRTELSDSQFFDLLKKSATTQDYKLPKKFLAYFLQFKVVKQMSNIQKITPGSIKSKPHFRVKLDTAKNQNTGFSQHELLFKLSRNNGAKVFYACPMLFDKAALYGNVNLCDLVCVRINSCPSQYSDNETHYIYFDAPSATPIWCSEPVEGTSINAEVFVKEVAETLDRLKPDESAKQVLELLQGLRQITLKESTGSADGQKMESGISLVQESLTIIEIEQPQLAGLQR